jgi:hypothetical protein
MNFKHLAKAAKNELSESKLEARSALNKALEASATAAEDEELEDENEEDETEPKKGDKSKGKAAEHDDLDDMADEDEDDDFTPATKQSKIPSKIHQPKPVQQASYIMKLFDRSVNLAKFDEEAPLYSLCRAWMENRPRAVGIKSEKVESSVPLTAVEDGDVVEIPRVRIRSKTKPLVSRSDNKLNKKEFDKKIDLEIWSKEKLIEYHKNRWQEERSRHIENSRVFEEKHFAANFELIESLMKEDDE